MKIFITKFCILWATKKRHNLTKFVDLKYMYSDLDVCHFCVAQNAKYLNKIFCTLVR
jgi:hypothetical protein